MNADLTSINGLSKLNVNIVETYFEALLFLINNYFFSNFNAIRRLFMLLWKEPTDPLIRITTR